MKIEVKIPEGWRRLRRNEITRKGDKYPLFDKSWAPTCNPGRKASGLLFGYYIRKIEKKTPTPTRRSKKPC